MWIARCSLAQTLIVLGRFDEVAVLAEGFDAPETASVVAAPMVALWAAIAVGGTGRRSEGEALLRSAVAHPLGGLVEPVAIAFQAFYVDWHAGRLDAAFEGAPSARSRSWRSSIRCAGCRSCSGTPPTSKRRAASTPRPWPCSSARGR